MKTMTCNQLGGPASCTHEFNADNFDDIKMQSMNHGKEMFAKGDDAHLAAMQAMKEKMQDPQAMQDWMAEKEAEFNALPDN